MNDLNTMLPHLKLKFHVDNPTLEECYVYGYECALADVDEADNPYNMDTPERDQWLEGWWAGFYNEQPLFTLESEVHDAEASAMSAVNDKNYHKLPDNYLFRVLEIAGVIAVSAIIGYQVIDIVA